MNSTLRYVHVDLLTQQLAAMLERSAYELPEDYRTAMRHAQMVEASEIGRIILSTLNDNFSYAASEQIPTCQDTGMAIVYVEVGQDVHLVGGDANEAIQQGVRDGYRQLRKSVVGDPLQRKNSGDNTPAIVHWKLVAGHNVKLSVMMKGFGAELMSRLQMFAPSVGVAGVKRFVMETIELAGPNACPPVIVGVGIGGSFDSVAGLAKRALMRELGKRNKDKALAALEAELLAEINASGIGPQGFGGSTTALAVHVESYATHIAALPVAVNLNCSAPRRASVVL